MQKDSLIIGMINIQNLFDVDKTKSVGIHSGASMTVVF